MTPKTRLTGCIACGAEFEIIDDGIRPPYHANYKGQNATCPECNTTGPVPLLDGFWQSDKEKGGEKGKKYAPPMPHKENKNKKECLTIGESWEALLKDAIPATASQSEIRERKVMFYCGAYASFGIITNTPGKYTADEGFKILSNVREELQAFRKEMKGAYDVKRN